MQPISYVYRFTMSDGKVKEFSFHLDHETLAMVRDAKPKQDYAPWTRLSSSQCPNCPLKESTHPQCPIAANIADIVDFFKHMISSDSVRVDIMVEDRKVSKETSMTDAISALLGVIMVTSGCPIMDKLRPMVRAHLPFSTIEETMYRTLAMYMLGQYFISRRGGDPDWTMGRLAQVFDDIRIVNRSFCQRLNEASVKDANINAVIHLDSFAELTNFALFERKDRLDRLEKAFKPYFPP